MNSVFFRFLQDTNAKSNNTLPAARILAYLGGMLRVLFAQNSSIILCAKSALLACGKDKRGGG